MDQPSEDPEPLAKPAPAPEPEVADALLSCDTAALPTSRTLLNWKVVPAADAAGREGPGEGQAGDGGSRVELTMDEEVLETLAKIDTKVLCRFKAAVLVWYSHRVDQETKSRRQTRTRRACASFFFLSRQRARGVGWLHREPPPHLATIVDCCAGGRAGGQEQTYSSTRGRLL